MTVARVRLAVAIFLAAGVITGAGASSASATLPTVSIDNVTAGEGSNAIFTITLSEHPIPALPVTFTVSLPYTLSAVPGVDYGLPATLPQTFTDTDSLTRTISVPLTCDFVTEGTEFFPVNITGLAPSGLLGSNGVGTIIDTCQGTNPPFFPGTSDLQMTSTPTAGSVLLGQPLSYDLLLSNLGPSPAQNVTVFDALPGGTSFSGASTGQGFCTGATCSLGTVFAGQSVPIHVTWLTGALGTLVNTATASSSTFDPNLANNATSAASSVVSSLVAGVGSAGTSVPIPATPTVTDATTSDSAPPGMELHYDRACHLIDDRVCVLDIRTDEDSRVRVVWNAIIPAFARTARASRVVGFRTISRSVSGDDSREIGLRPSRRVRLLIANALAHRVPVTGRFRITATDAAHNVRTLGRSFRIVR